MHIQPLKKTMLRADLPTRDQVLAAKRAMQEERHAVAAITDLVFACCGVCGWDVMALDEDQAQRAMVAHILAEHRQG
jgi:hypothetical protein